MAGRILLTSLWGPPPVSRQSRPSQSRVSIGMPALRGAKYVQLLGDLWKTFRRQAQNDVNNGIFALEGRNVWKYWKMCGRRLEDAWKTL